MATEPIKEQQGDHHAQPSPRATGLSILVAEDNFVNQKIISYMLLKMQYAADFAQNGSEAVDAVAAKKYDIVFMDVQMPEMDGLEATRRIRQLSIQQPFIIAMTANALEGDRQECIAAGMDDYISKPINLTDLKELLDKRESEKKSQ